MLDDYGSDIQISENYKKAQKLRPMPNLQIHTGGLDCPDVVELLREHLSEMRNVSPPESSHALDMSGLRDSSVSFWHITLDDQIAGCAALKRLSTTHAEIKSMRTAKRHRGQGVAKRMMQHILEDAIRHGYQRLSLETGSMIFFAPARKLYEQFGFDYCKPFADYVADPNSLFMSLDL